MKRTSAALPLLVGCTLAWLSACALATGGLGGSSASSSSSSGSGGRAASSGTPASSGSFVGSSSTASSGTTGATGGGATTGSGTGGTSSSTGGAATSSTASTSSTGTGGCSAGTKLCKGMCVSDSDPTYGCAASGCAACPIAAHETASCDSNGACTTACQAPFADCDGNTGNGCETDTSSNPANCGSCGNACPGPGGQAACSNSACGLTCPAGKADCDGDPSNGCEVDTTNDPNNCGACNNACPSGFNCSGGNCVCSGNNSCNNGNLTMGFFCHQNTNPGKCQCGPTTCNYGQRCNSSDQCQ